MMRFSHGDSDGTRAVNRLGSAKIAVLESAVRALM